MKKWIKTAVTALLAVGMLSGCGSDKDAPLEDMDVEKYVTLGEYKGIDLQDPLAIDEESVKIQADSLYFMAAYNGGIEIDANILDRAVEIGDTVSIDYEGMKDGVAFGGGTAEGYYLTIGSDRFIDGFEEGLIGVMPGETVDLNLTFPEQYSNADLAGQAVVFRVTVNGIMPEERDRAIVSLVGIDGVSDMEGLLQYVEDWMYNSAQSSYIETLQNGVLTALMENCSFQEMPESMLTRYEETIRSNIETQAGYYGMDAESFIAAVYGMDLDKFVTDSALETARQNVAIQAVANREGLNVSDEELQEMLLEYATQAGFSTVEEYLGELTEEDYREYFTYNKVIAFLIENANLME
ncbi:MAG: FKBP-type peptidyl-prolyl cis-trans isomerase [Candidatus Gastranaerophilales bacterium]|nr:FKBP-type peptidyl-prolyl cis-trans isomerase [Candidatus Gastranaerophilales bacterium]